MNDIVSQGLSKRFLRTEALNDVSFAVPRGSVTVLVGANGAGKTTLLRCLVNLLRPTAGEATVLGVPGTRLQPRDWTRIAFVSDDTRTPPLSVGGLLACWRPLYPTWDHDLEARLLRQFELPLDRPFDRLSRGQRMKARLLCALAYRPAVLLLDEPFGGLDPLVREEVTAGLVTLVADAGTTVLVSSHDISEVETLADRLLWLDQGRLALDEEADSLRQRFRRIAAPASATPPAEAWELETGAGIVRYIDPHFAMNRLAPGATEAPLSLREILLACLRHHSISRSSPTQHPRAA